MLKHGKRGAIEQELGIEFNSLKGFFFDAVHGFIVVPIPLDASCF